MKHTHPVVRYGKFKVGKKIVKVPYLHFENKAEARTFEKELAERGVMVGVTAGSTMMGIGAPVRVGNMIGNVVEQSIGGKVLSGISFGGAGLLASKSGISNVERNLKRAYKSSKGLKERKR